MSKLKVRFSMSLQLNQQERHVLHALLTEQSTHGCSVEPPDITEIRDHLASQIRQMSSIEAIVRNQLNNKPL